MIRLVGLALTIAATGAQASHWVAIATGPEADPTGLYVDRDSIKGALPKRTLWEKFVNSYREQQLSLVEMDCTHSTWRAVKRMSRSPNGSLLKGAKLPDTKINPIAPNSPQDAVRRLVCRNGRDGVTVKHKSSRR